MRRVTQSLVVVAAISVVVLAGVRVVGWAVSERLFVAVTDGRHDELRWLLVIGANPDIRDRTGRTPLLLALEQENVAAAEVLVAHGADPNLADHAGQTPLCADLEIWSPAHIDAVRALLHSGARANGSRCNSQNLMVYYIRRGDPSLEVLEMLAKAGEEMPSEQARHSLVRYAERVGYQDVVDWLNSSTQ